MARTSVSICTPTYNRPKYIYNLITYVLNQDYPHHLIEWIIMDDSGDNKVQSILPQNSAINIRYVFLPKRIPLGEKRNKMNDLCNGDIIVNMDDDDYYPPCRISYAVKQLLDNPSYLCAGSSKMPIWYINHNEMWMVGPYSDNHATANTFAYRKELLSIARYNDQDTCAEEKHFLKGYTIPMIQLRFSKTCTQIAHSANTFDKSQLRSSPAGRRIRMKPPPFRTTTPKGRLKLIRNQYK
jgi:glycosyltransferase involved in cell wall biosynthesis